VSAETAKVGQGRRAPFATLIAMVAVFVTHLALGTAFTVASPGRRCARARCRSVVLAAHLPYSFPMNRGGKLISFGSGQSYLDGNHNVRFVEADSDTPTFDFG
jgi:hypothetical protein